MKENSSTWPILITELVRVKERIERAHPGFWPHHLPELRADPELLDRTESSLGRSLPPSYRRFLLHADGWKGFFQTVDLLSCEQLVRGRHRDHFERAYSWLAPEDWDLLGLRRDETLVIGVTVEDRDVFVLGAPEPATGEQEVVWLAGSLVDRWSTFYEFFKSMIEYSKLMIDSNRREI